MNDQQKGSGQTKVEQIFDLLHIIADRAHDNRTISLEINESLLGQKPQDESKEAKVPEPGILGQIIEHLKAINVALHNTFTNQKEVQEQIQNKK